jgi:hypothetical protein
VLFSFIRNPLSFLRFSGVRQNSSFVDSKNAAQTDDPLALVKSFDFSRDVVHQIAFQYVLTLGNPKHQLFNQAFEIRAILLVLVILAQGQADTV